ncbi:MAG: 4Fe-4S binding protein [Deltaproteobacteria bacterium]|jgi:ferredoxin|nr:4Fe-4S binding protein [Deltaproteobacteria bacterium]
MSAKISQEKCIRCGNCMDECPEGAICYEENNVPFVIEEDCTNCGLCVSVCSTEAVVV